MMGKTKPLFTLSRGTWAESALFGLMFSFPLFASGNILLSLCLCVPLLLLYRILTRRFLRMQRDYLVGFCYSKPLKKTYRYRYEDISKVYVSIPDRHGYKMKIYFKNGYDFSIRVHDDMESICHFFIDKAVPLDIRGYQLNKAMAQYKLRRKVAPTEQIRLRKIRAAKRKQRTGMRRKP